MNYRNEIRWKIVLIESDFTVTKRANIEYPWEGQHICLKLGKTK